MPFNPRLVGSDDEDGLRDDQFSDEVSAAFVSSEAQLPESELPDDLLVLVEQLVDDADRLAAAYPSGQPELWLTRHTREEKPSKQPAQFSPLDFWYHAAVAVLIIGLGVGGGTLWMGSGSVDSVFAPTQVAGPIQTFPVAPASGTEPEEESQVLPAAFFSLSGPQQEALLDLMESEELGQPSLSI